MKIEIKSAYHVELIAETDADKVLLRMWNDMDGCRPTDFRNLDDGSVLEIEFASEHRKEV